MTKRTKGKIKDCVSLKESYNYYKTEYDNPVDYKTFTKYIKECNQEILSSVVDEADDVELPYRLGLLHIVKYERSYANKKKWAIDFNETRKKGFTVYFEQDYIYKWRWGKTHTIVKNKNKYKFTAARTAKRMVPAALARKVDYYTL